MLSVRDLHVSYGERSALRGVSLDVSPGEFVALVGPNGCGKTTLLKAITRVVAWTRGEVFVGETEVRSLGPRGISRQVAVVPQNALLPVGYTSIEVVLMGRTPHLGFLDQESGADVEIARFALERVGGGALAERPVDELSGGERQNVVLARALAQETPILLLDEPTANLDIGHQVGIARLMRELAASGLAVLAAIHDLTLASLYADRVALMEDGRIVECGSPEAVLTEANLRAVYDSPVRVLTGVLPRPVVVPWEQDPGES